MKPLTVLPYVSIQDHSFIFDWPGDQRRAIYHLDEVRFQLSGAENAKDLSHISVHEIGSSSRFNEYLLNREPGIGLTHAQVYWHLNIL